MSKSNVAHKEEVEGEVLVNLTGVTAKVVSRGDGPEYTVNAADVHPDKWPTLFNRAVSDVITALSQVGIIKPNKEDFLNEAEHAAALEEWKAEKLARKETFAKAFSAEGADFPSTSVWTRISPVRQVMNEIADEDLRKYFNGHQVRESKPKGVFAFPENKELVGIRAKWLAKYGDEIQAEAQDRIANGHKPTTVEAPKADSVDF